MKTVIIATWRGVPRWSGFSVLSLSDRKHPRGPGFLPSLCQRFWLCETATFSTGVSSRWDDVPCEWCRRHLFFVSLFTSQTTFPRSPPALHSHVLSARIWPHVLPQPVMMGAQASPFLSIYMAAWSKVDTLPSETRAWERMHFGEATSGICRHTCSMFNFILTKTLSAVCLTVDP